MVNNMANFANVQIPTGYVLDPTLKELVDKLALRNPTHTYSARGMNADIQESNSSVRPRNTRGMLANREDGLRYLYRLHVHCGSELLGVLFLDIRYGRHVGSEIVYGIKSWRIQKERGNQNLTRTAKLDAALRAAKAAFVPQNTDEIMDKADDLTSRALAQALADLKRPITHGTLVRNFSALQQYLFCLLSNKEIPVSLKQAVEPCMTSDKYKTAMAEYELAKHMDSVLTQTIVAHSEGYLMRVDESDNKRVTKYFSFDELPSRTQERVAVLQLMQDNELVYDVGFRLNDTCFSIPV